MGDANKGTSPPFDDSTGLISMTTSAVATAGHSVASPLSHADTADGLASFAMHIPTIWQFCSGAVAAGEVSATLSSK